MKQKVKTRNVLFSLGQFITCSIGKKNSISIQPVANDIFPPFFSKIRFIFFLPSRPPGARAISFTGKEKVEKRIKYDRSIHASQPEKNGKKER